MLTGRKIGVAVVTILLLVSSFMPLIEMNNVELEPDDSVVADVLVLDLLPDPNLQDPPDVIVSIVSLGTGFRVCNLELH
jgi:hypothetical protein